MKKIVLLFAIALVSIGCSNSDNGGNSSSDKIIGTWGEYQEEYLPTNEIDTFITYQQVITFKSDGSVDSNYRGIPTTGTWENLGNGIYKLSLSVKTVNQQIEFVGSNEMIIYDDGNSSWAYYYEKTK